MRTTLLVTAILGLGLLAATLPSPGDDTARAKALLAPFAGTWATEFSMVGMPASKGAEVVTAFPHGLAVAVTSRADGYEGHGLIGYDPRTGKYMHVWADTMTPGLMVSEGHFSADGKSFTVEGEHETAAGKVPVDMTMHIDDADHMTWTMKPKGDDAAPAIMSMKYTRKP